MKLPPHIIYKPYGYHNCKKFGCYLNMITNKTIPVDKITDYLKQQKPMVYWYTL